MIKHIPIQRAAETSNVESLNIDGCKVTIRFVERSNQRAAEEIKKILTDSIIKK